MEATMIQLCAAFTVGALIGGMFGVWWAMQEIRRQVREAGGAMTIYDED